MGSLKRKYAESNTDGWFILNPNPPLESEIVFPDRINIYSAANFTVQKPPSQ
jgi:hypothetical protein